MEGAVCAKVLRSKHAQHTPGTSRRRMCLERSGQAGEGGEEARSLRAPWALGKSLDLIRSTKGETVGGFS